MANLSKPKLLHLIFSFLHTRSLLVPCAYISINSIDSILFPSLELNPNIAGLFEASFFWGGEGFNLISPSYFKKNLSTIVKKSI